MTFNRAGERWRHGWDTFFALIYMHCHHGKLNACSFHGNICHQSLESVGELRLCLCEYWWRSGAKFSYSQKKNFLFVPILEKYIEFRRCSAILMHSAYMFTCCDMSPIYWDRVYSGTITTFYCAALVKMQWYMVNFKIVKTSWKNLCAAILVNRLMDIAPFNRIVNRFCSCPVELFSICAYLF